MAIYMVVIELSERLTDEFYNLIPEQKEHVNELINEAKILHYAVAFNRSAIWLTVSAANEVEARKIVDAFPLREYMKPVYTELAMYSSVSWGLPKLIMN